ncbi:MAG: GH3 auxin-responsive promoter family protein [Acidobacteria bacterium]|nr:GH3 auxin-responsive promoter family protein [Acidobacteriota bacterium]
MNAGASAANLLWLARSQPAARWFARAARDPRATQEAWLLARLARHATSVFGREHNFATIRNAGDFARQVPLTTAAAVAPWVERIRHGESDVLACGRVSHLVPTSGSTGSRKLIPFSAALQEGFDAAVATWMVDLTRQRPALRWGPAYWSVSPPGDEPADEQPGAVPIGFADDADYLGGASAWLVRRALAVPSSVRHARDLPTFWRLTLSHLLSQRDLRLLSVWHPSFLDLLLQAADANWTGLVESLPAGRAAELRRIGPSDWPRWWPHLQVVSCWGDQAAAPGFRRLVARVPHVLVQPKGLLATEAVVTIPYEGTQALAVTSHYFEFIDDAGDVRGAHALERGAHYEVVVTNGGGLWRYLLGDVVECTGHLGALPTLRFLGRRSRQSDLRGEKLSEPFVAEVLGSLWADAATPAYQALRAWDTDGAAGYDLLVAGEHLSENFEGLAERLDVALGANPHYALARRLGQLAAPRVLRMPADHGAVELAAATRRLGDIKPEVLIGANAGPR